MAVVSVIDNSGYNFSINTETISKKSSRNALIGFQNTQVRGLKMNQDIEFSNNIC
jgi:hypothetical protein